MSPIVPTCNMVNSCIKDMHDAMQQLDHREPAAHEELCPLLIELKELQEKVWRVYDSSFPTRKESELAVLHKLGCSLDRVASIPLSFNNLNSSKINNEGVNKITENMKNLNNLLEESPTEVVSDFITSNNHIQPILVSLNNIKNYIKKHVD